MDKKLEKELDDSHKEAADSQVAGIVFYAHRNPKSNVVAQGIMIRLMTLANYNCHTFGIVPFLKQGMRICGVTTRRDAIASTAKELADLTGFDPEGSFYPYDNISEYIRSTKKRLSYLFHDFNSHEPYVQYSLDNTDFYSHLSYHAAMGVLKTVKYDTGEKVKNIGKKVEK